MYVRYTAVKIILPRCNTPYKTSRVRPRPAVLSKLNCSIQVVYCCSLLKNYDKTVRRARLREIRNVKYMTKA